MRRLLLVGLGLLGVILRIHDLGRRSLWSDELEHVFAAQAPIPELWVRLKIQLTPPFDYLVSHLFLKLEPIWPFSFESLVRLPACLAGIASLGLAYRLSAQRSPSLRFGVMAGTAMSVFLINYSQECRPYSLLFLLCLWSIFEFQRQNWKVWMLVNSVGVATHYFFPLIVLVQAVHWFWRRNRGSSLIFLRGILVYLAVWLLITPLFFEQLSQVSSDPSYRYGVSSGWTFLPTLLAQFAWPFSSIPVLGWIILTLMVAGSFSSNTDALIRIWAWVPLLCAWLVSFFLPVATSKNMILVFFPSLILALAGADHILSHLPSAHHIKRVVCAGFLITLTWAIWHYGSVEKEDYRGVARWIGAHANSGAILMEQEYGFGPVYFTKYGIQENRFVDYWVPQWNKEPRATLLEKLSAMMAPSVFVSRHLDDSLERKIMRGAKLTQTVEFAGLTVRFRSQKREPQSLAAASRLQLCASKEGFIYAVGELCCATRKDPAPLLQLKWPDGVTEFRTVSPGGKLYPPHLWPNDPFSFPVALTLAKEGSADWGTVKAHFSGKKVPISFYPGPALPSCDWISREGWLRQAPDPNAARLP